MTTLTLFRTVNAMRWSLIALLAIMLFLTACGGSTSTPGMAAVAAAAPPVAGAPAPITTCPDGTSAYPSCDPIPPAPDPVDSAPAPSEPTATGTDSGSAPLPACLPGHDFNVSTTCTCPPTEYNMAPNTCDVPVPPPPSPVNPAPTMSLSAAPNPVQPGGSAVLTWTSKDAQTCYGAAGWPTSDIVTPSGFANTGVLNTTTSYTLVCTGIGGDASTSIVVQVNTPAPPPSVSPPSSPGSPPAPSCTPPDVLIAGACSAPPTVSLTLSVSPTTVTDASRGCPGPDGTACISVVTVTPVSSLANDAFFCNNATGGEVLPNWYSTEPYGPLQDGPQIITVTCHDIYAQSAAASITLLVIAPGPPPGDSFTGVYAGNFESLTWTTYSGATCSVEQFDTQGNEVTLVPGGTASGSSTSGFLSPSREPFTFQLYCGGSANLSVPSITVNP